MLLHMTVPAQFVYATADFFQKLLLNLKESSIWIMKILMLVAVMFLMVILFFI